MKKIITLLLTIVSFSCHSEKTSPLTGIAKNYELLDETSSSELFTKENIVPVILINGESIEFEKDKLSDIQKKLGGDINNSGSTGWICFNSPSTSSTYWFLSDNEMQHGHLSGIAISSLDESSACNITNKKIFISLNDLKPKTPWRKVAKTWGVKQKPKSGVLRFFSEKEMANDFTQLNGVNYYINNGFLDGILYTQVTSN